MPLECVRGQAANVLPIADRKRPAPRRIVLGLAGPRAVLVGKHPAERDHGENRIGLKDFCFDSGGLAGLPPPAEPRQEGPDRAPSPQTFLPSRWEAGWTPPNRRLTGEATRFSTGRCPVRVPDNSWLIKQQDCGCRLAQPRCHAWISSLSLCVVNCHRRAEFGDMTRLDPPQDTDDCARCVGCPTQHPKPTNNVVTLATRPRFARRSTRESKLAAHT